MADIKDLLSKFNNIVNKGSAEKEVIVRVFERVLNIKINKEDISFRRETLIIKSDSYLKAEINLNKEALLKEIKKQGLEKFIKDIK